MDFNFKNPSPVWMKRIEEDMLVVTDSGTLEAKAGDWLCYDDISKHVWPISNDYKNQHYAPSSRVPIHPEFPEYAAQDEAQTGSTES